MLFYKLFFSFQIKGPKYKTLNSNISASRQNIKNLNCNFGDIHIRIMHANFQASIFRCGRRMSWGTYSPSLYKISKLSLCFASAGISDKNITFTLIQKGICIWLRTKSGWWVQSSPMKAIFQPIDSKKIIKAPPIQGQNNAQWLFQIWFHFAFIVWEYPAPGYFNMGQLK